MKIVRTGNSNGPVMAVLASMDEELPRTRNLVGELQRYGIDSLIVVDSGPEFKFARSMNAGIREALSLEHVRQIILSNDDVSNVQGIGSMIHFLENEICDYATPCVNGRTPGVSFTNSPLRAMINYTVTKKAPFFPLRIMRMTRPYAKNKKVYISMPVFFSRTVVSVMPFCMFNRNVLEAHMFDEEYHNGVEDDDLAYRLWYDGFRGGTSKMWNVHHTSGASFKSIRPKGNNESIYGSNEQTARNSARFSDKFYFNPDEEYQSS